jgi:hypothetical protein
MSVLPSVGLRDTKIEIAGKSPFAFSPISFLKHPMAVKLKFTASERYYVCQWGRIKPEISCSKAVTVDTVSRCRPENAAYAIIASDIMPL